MGVILQPPRQSRGRFPGCCCRAWDGCGGAAGMESSEIQLYSESSSVGNNSCPAMKHPGWCCPGCLASCFKQCYEFTWSSIEGVVYFYESRPCVFFGQDFLNINSSSFALSPCSDPGDSACFPVLETVCHLLCCCEAVLGQHFCFPGSWLRRAGMLGASTEEP